MFSNTERPYSCPQGPTSRPFSGGMTQTLKFQPGKVLSRAGLNNVSSAKLTTMAPIPENDKAATEADFKQRTMLQDEKQESSTKLIDEVGS